MQALIRQRKSDTAVKAPDWSKAFGNRNPLEVDLGCGRGSYALARASMLPEVNVVAIDTRPKWIQGIRKKAADRKLSNLRAIRCDATQDLPLLFGVETVSGFSIFHPDPWWKKRHRKRRLVNPNWVILIGTLLVPRGWVFVQTDVPDMFEEIRAVFEKSKIFEAMDADAFVAQHMQGASSHRARRCKELGIPVKKMAVRKIQTSGECS